MEDSTFIALGIIFCGTAIIITIIYFYSKQKQQDKKIKMHPVISGILITVMLLILSLIAEIIGSLEKGWTRDHLWWFVLIFILWVGFNLVMFFVNKIKPFNVRYKKVIQFTFNHFNASFVIDKNKESTIITNPRYNRAFIYGNGFDVKAVDVFLLNLRIHTSKTILVVSDILTMEVIYFHVSPQHKIVNEWLVTGTINMNNIQAPESEEGDDKTTVKKE